MCRTAVRPAGHRARAEAELVEQVTGEVGMRLFSAAAPIRLIAWAMPTSPWLWAPTITFSSRLIEGNRARFWNVRAMPREAMPWAGTASRSWPSYVTARGRFVDAADDVEHGRLAGTVGTDQAADVTGLDPEGQAVESDDATEANRHVLHVDQGHRLAPPRSPGT